MPRSPVPLPWRISGQIVDAQPVFIVGLPRSGTTLLTAMLGAHPAFACGPETAFFMRLPRDTSRLLDPTHWPDRAVEHLSSNQRRGVPFYVLYGLDRAQVHDALARREPSVAAMLETITSAYARAAGKPRWAEKSPRHILFLPRLREAFPEAPIVRIVRDPRDVALSVMRAPFGGSSLMVNLYECARLSARTEPIIRRDQRLLTVRFEDLVAQPELESRRLCDFVREPFDPRMLEQGESAAAIGDRSEWWLAKAAERPDSSRLAVWRRELTPRQQRAAAAICHDILERHDYPDRGAPRGRLALRPDGIGLVKRWESWAGDLAADGVVLSGRSWTRSPALVFWPRDGKDPWRLGRARLRRAARLVVLAGMVGYRRLAGKRTVWLRPRGGNIDGRPRSLATRAAERILRLSAGPPESAEPSAAAQQAVVSTQS